MGYLLHSHIHLIPKHSPSTKIHPIYSPYLLFENTMSRTKFNAMVSGLFQLGSSYEWIITKKAGRASEPDPLAVEDRESKAMNHPPFHWGVSESGISELNKLKEHQESGAKPPVKKMNKLYKKELALAFLLSYCCTQEPFISSRATFLLLAIPRQYSGDDGQYVFDKSLQTSMVLLMKFSYQ